MTSRRRRARTAGRSGARRQNARLVGRAAVVGTQTDRRDDGERRMHGSGDAPWGRRDRSGLRQLGIVAPERYVALRAPVAP